MSIDFPAFCIYFCPVDESNYISQEEKSFYKSIIESHRGKFISLGNYFLKLIDKAVIYGNHSGVNYSAYHLFNQPETKKAFIELRNTLKILCEETPKNKYPILLDNLTNIVIVLSEPETFKEDKKYQTELNTVWREIVENDDVLKNNANFRQYLKK